MKNLVSIEWLKNNMDKENLVILDVRHVLGDEDYGKEEYRKGHIPNAIFVPVEELLTGEIKSHGGRHPLPDMNEFTQNMNDLGVDDESTVVIYDDEDLAMAGRLWWMFRYIGFKESYVLQGGFEAWKSNNYPTSTDVPKIGVGNKLTLDLQENMIVDIHDVKKSLENDKHVVIDSRTADRYRGEVEPIDKIAGHIPGALNLSWKALSKFNVDFDESIVKEHFQSVADYEKIIVHCGSGITGTVNVLFMNEVGLSPALYVGGYSDWISYPENEVATDI